MMTNQVGTRMETPVRRLSTSIAVLGSVLMMSVVLGPTALAAVDDTDMMTTHPLVGAWVIETQAYDGNRTRTLILIDPAGLVTAASKQGVGLGAWQPTGDRTADLTFRFFDKFQLGKLRASAEVSEDGQRFTASATVEVSDDLFESTGPLGPIAVSATRIAVEPMDETSGKLRKRDVKRPPWGAGLSEEHARELEELTSDN